MSTELSYPHIAQLADGTACLERHPRTRVAQIAMDYLAHGWSASEMCRQHPHLREAEIHAALGYYFDHQDEIDAETSAEIRHVKQEATASPPSPLRRKLEAKGLL